MRPQELRVEVRSSRDILRARRQARELALKLGFAGSQVALIAAATSEVARNIVDYAAKGEILFESLRQGRRQGMLITARDEGPGIADVGQAMQYGYSTGHRLGAGLPGAKWLMDEFEIASKPGRGTTIRMKKWLN